VLLIDEAHAMPAESLEEIRLLSNLESKATKLLQIALFAQPELDERLAATDMRQLRERITQHFNLAPLKKDDVAAAIIEFRLRAAGYHGPNPFTDEAVEMIARISEGLSRRINILADKALLAAYSSGSHQVEQRRNPDRRPGCAFLAAAAKATTNLKPLGWGLAGAAIAAAIVAHDHHHSATRPQPLLPQPPTKQIRLDCRHSHTPISPNDCRPRRQAKTRLQRTSASAR
jgi:MSHA biogenesis protein MshM